jgi:hypothetical protein
MVPRRIFGPNLEEPTGGLRKLRKSEFPDSYWTTDAVRMIKSRMM